MYWAEVAADMTRAQTVKFSEPKRANRAKYRSYLSPTEPVPNPLTEAGWDGGWPLMARWLD